VSDLRRAARDAVVVGTPTVRLHRWLVRTALDRLTTDFRAPLNTLWHEPPTAPGHDPEHSAGTAWAWVDLRVEPVVLGLPEVDPAVSTTVGLLDLAGGIRGPGPRSHGGSSHAVLVTGPGRGDVAEPMLPVLACPTALGLLRVRISPREGTGQDVVAGALAALRLDPGSAWSGIPAPGPAAGPPLADLVTVDVRRPLDAHFLHVLDVMAPLMPGWPADPVLRARLALLGIGDGGLAALLADPVARPAIEAGLADGQAVLRRRAGGVGVGAWVGDAGGVASPAGPPQPPTPGGAPG
jgi:hypothetical protein